jgi:hypothetical protein
LAVDSEPDASLQRAGHELRRLVWSALRAGFDFDQFVAEREQS